MSSAALPALEPVRSRTLGSVGPRWTELGRRGWFDPLLIAVLTFLVGAVGYWRPSIWTDEAATITAAERTVPQLWAMLHNIDAVHGPYYLFMHFWIDLFGSSAASIRFPSLLAVAAAGAGTVVLARSLTNRQVALLSGIVFALLPRITWAGTEARSTAMTVAAATWLTVALVAAMRRGRWWWVLYGALTTVSVVLYLYVVLVLLAHGVTVLWANRAHLRRSWPWFAATAAGVLLTTPFALMVARQAGQIHPGAPHLVHTLSDVGIKQWFLGAPPTYNQSFPWRTLPYWALAALALAAVCWALIAWAVLARRDRLVVRRRPAVGLLALLLPWLVLPTGVLVAYSALHHPIYNPRYLAYCATAVAILLGVAIATLARRWAQVLVLVIIAVLALPVYVSQRRIYSKKANDWVTVAKVLQQRARPGDVVVYGARTSRFLNTRRIEVAYPQPLTQLRDITLDRTGVQMNTLWGSSHPLAQVAGQLAGAQRVWLISDRLPGAVHSRALEMQEITAHGFHRTWSWKGPATLVVEYRS